MSAKAKTLARRLLRQNRGTASITARSWRVIAREDYENKIPPGTLNRFALSDGAWLPKDEHQILLGLKHVRTITPRRKSFIFNIPEPDPRTIRQMMRNIQ